MMYRTAAGSLRWPNRAIQPDYSIGVAYRRAARQTRALFVVSLRRIFSRWHRMLAL